MSMQTANRVVSQRIAWLVSLLVLLFSVVALTNQAHNPPVEKPVAAVPQVDDSQAILDRVLRRMTGVVSGRFELTRSTGFRQDENSRTPRGPYRFSLSGKDWARRALEQPHYFTVNKDDQMIQLWPQPVQDDGSHPCGAQFRAPVRTIKVEQDSSPFFAGTFWSEEMYKFVRQHRDRVRLVGEEVLDGHTTLILEWKLQPDEAFQVQSSANGVTMGATSLRVYTAPAMDYVLPRIDIVGKDNVVGCRYESTGFVKSPQGTWFPRNSVCQWSDPDPRFYEEYEFTSVSLLNELVPDEDFEFSVPADTRVTDSRDRGNVVSIHTDREMSQPEIEVQILESYLKTQRQ